MMARRLRLAAGVGCEASTWTPEERAAYARSLRVNVSKTNRLQGQALADVRRQLEAARREVVERMVWAQAKADAGGSSYDLARLGQLQQDIQGVLLELGARFPETAAEWGVKLAALASETVTAPLSVVLGGDLLPPFALSRSIAAASALTQAELITRVTRETVRRISTEIDLAAMGVKSPFEAMEAVGRSLDSPSIFGSIATRAEVIVRTELGRVQSLAGQARLEEAAQWVHTLQKQWMHSGKATGRASHIAAHGQIRDVQDDYEVGGARLRFPRDPAASAATTIGCGCSSLPYVDGLSEALPAAA